MAADSRRWNRDQAGEMKSSVEAQPLAASLRSEST
jgi:hypothetical protein